METLNNYITEKLRISSKTYSEEYPEYIKFFGNGKMTNFGDFKIYKYENNNEISVTQYNELYKIINSNRNVYIIEDECITLSQSKKITDSFKSFIRTHDKRQKSSLSSDDIYLSICEGEYLNNMHVKCILLKDFSDIMTVAVTCIIDIENQNINEKLKISSKNYKQYKYHPTTKEELQDIIEQLIKERGNEADLNDIDVSEITDMGCLFYDNKSFNGDISKWDVSNVTDMQGMFCGSIFDGDISNWDVSSVENMHSMFWNSNFTGKNGNLSNWNVSKVKDMAGMFCNCPFNGNISDWKTYRVKDMNNMFNGCKNFNCDLCNWDVSSVEKMYHMFNGCINFEGVGLENWDVRRVNDFGSMFDNCKKLNCNLKNWKVYKDDRTFAMFWGCPIENNPPSWYKD